VSVAQYARVRGATSKVLVYKIIDYKISELISDVEDIVGEAVTNGKGTGVVNRIETAASSLF
jgi:hypothetical protein